MDATPSWGERLLGLDGRRLVLASSSPRRADLLSALGIRFVARAAGLDETVHPGETPPAAVERLALEKARAVAESETDALVVGADTVVVVGGGMLGKPAGEAEARSMLGALSGRAHEVVTGVALIAVPGGRAVSGHTRTEVHFRSLEEEDLAGMVESGEAFDKAGAYGIQGLAALMVEGITGDYCNVVGLPLGLLRRLIREEAKP